MASEGLFDDPEKQKILMDTLKGLQRESFHEEQSERLTILVRHAYDNVALYRKKYDEAGLKPDDIASVDDLHKLPFITKDDLRNNFPDGLLAKNIDPADCFIVGTSGSSGSPVKIYRDTVPSHLASFSVLMNPKIWSPWVGVDTAKKVQMVMGIMVMAEYSFEKELIKQFQEAPWISNESFRILDALMDPREHLRVFQELKPNVLFGYPSAIKNLAIVAREDGVELHQPVFFVTAGEVLDGHTRMVISSAFKGRLFDVYGSTEGNAIAFECLRHEGMHVAPRRVILELLDDDEKPVPPGVPGRVVVTDLTNMATPILRYIGLGDVAVWAGKPCSCGIRWPLLERVGGRIVDSFVLPDKSLVHPFRLTPALETIPGIATFQLVQEEIDRVRVRIVEEKGEGESGEGPSPFQEGGAQWTMIMESLGEILGEGVHITIDRVDDIPRFPAMSHAVVRSLVDRPEGS